jgi:signal transduction histidine kinase
MDVRRVGALVGPAVAGVGVGLTAERFGYGWDDPAHWAPDLMVGWAFIGFGLIAWMLRPNSMSGILMVLAGFTWFLGNFSLAGVAAVSWVAGNALYLHRGVLVQLVLTYPIGRLYSWLVRATVAAVYVIALLRPFWQSEVATIVLSALVVGVSLCEYVTAVGRSRRARLLGLRATAGLGLLLAGEAALRLSVPSGELTEPLLLAYEVALTGLAVALLIGLLVGSWERAAVTDLVVELGEARSGTLRSELSRAIGDPTLDVGFWLPEAEAFVDAEGRPVVLPDEDRARSVTIIERDGQRVAALVHDPAVLEDSGLLEAVSSAAQLAASNVRLRAEVRTRLEELYGSRRRILDAEDSERERLAHRLQQGAEHRLEQLRDKLRAARALGVSEATAERVAQAEAQLTQTLTELGELAGGLHPRILAEAGLGGALTALAERIEVPVVLSFAADALPSQVEAAAYFVCSEALANVVKYASASRVSVSVRIHDGRVTVEVEDDGVGGADLRRGSGLRGLADRVEALGGTLRLDSPRSHGTRLIAEIPFGSDGR